MVQAISGIDQSDRPIIHTSPVPINDRVIFNDWYAIAALKTLEPGSVRSVQLLDHQLVLWRGTGASIQVWEDRCPHRSVRLSAGKVVDDAIVCPYHGMVYDATGACVHVPAHPTYKPPQQACARSYPVQIQYGLVFVCLGDDPQAIAPFPEWGLPDYLSVLSGPHFCQTGGYRAIENFLDVAHFAHVHTHILGDPTMPEVGDYRVTMDDRGVHLHGIEVWQPNAMGDGQGALISYDYSALRPLTAYLRKDDPSGKCLTLLYCVTPVSEESCVSWMLMAVNYLDPSQEAAAIAFQDLVVGQDIANLESHNPKKLPLDPTAEFHVPCDRGSLAYRKWLRQLGVTYGVLR